VQTKDATAAAAAAAGSSGGAAGGAGNILVEEGAAAAGGNPAMGVAEGGVSDEALGEWGKVTSALTAAPGSGVGMSGVSKEKMEPFKWDDSIPKLADRRFSTHVHVRVYVYVYVNVCVNVYVHDVYVCVYSVYASAHHCSFSSPNFVRLPPHPQNSLIFLIFVAEMNYARRHRHI